MRQIFSTLVTDLSGPDKLLPVPDKLLPEQRKATSAARRGASREGWTQPAPGAADTARPDAQQRRLRMGRSCCWALFRKAGTMLQLLVQTTLPLARPLADQGFVTWLDIHVIDRSPATEETLKAEGLDALTTCIEAHDYMFGLDLNDLLYLSQLRLEGARRPQNLDVALVQTIYETLAHASALVVVPYVDDPERWAQAGFEPEHGTYNPTYLCWDTRDCQDRVEVEEPHEPANGHGGAQPAAGSSGVQACSPARGAIPSGPLLRARD
jgi:hypothetical protein